MPAAFGEVAEQLRRSTVQVRVDEGRAGSGSGVVWSADGRIISNAHVVRGDRVEVEFWDGSVVRARLLKRDVNRDLALLDTGRKDVVLPRWADSSALHHGQTVLAVGNPLGFIGALSTGQVHAVGPVNGLGGQDWVQARIQLAPGNSGGALADEQGAIVGINTMVAGPMGLAVPSNAVARFIRRRMVLGVTLEMVDARAGRQPVSGWRIQQIVPGSKADLASLRTGDVIIGIGGQYLAAPDDLEDRLIQGGLVKLEFLRGSNPIPREVHVELGNPREEWLDAAA